MPHPLDSARERLKRAKENTQALDSEISRFVSHLPVIRFKGEDLVFTDDDRKAFEMLRDFALKREVPSRFSVLSGEVIHHLRSAFDHVIWQLSSPALRSSHPHRIEFPVFDVNPTTDKNKLDLYGRKVDGISSATALAQIKSLQPYLRGTDFANHPLWLIHDMDRIDKHRDLVIVVAGLGVQLDAISSRDWVLKHDAQGKPIWALPVFGTAQVQVGGKLAPQVSFRDFGSSKDEPIIRGLKQLTNFAHDAVESFAREFV